MISFKDFFNISINENADIEMLHRIEGLARNFLDSYLKWCDEALETIQNNRREQRPIFITDLLVQFMQLNKINLGDRVVSAYFLVPKKNNESLGAISIDNKEKRIGPIKIFNKDLCITYDNIFRLMNLLNDSLIRPLSPDKSLIETAIIHLSSETKSFKVQIEKGYEQLKKVLVHEIGHGIRYAKDIFTPNKNLGEESLSDEKWIKKWQKAILSNYRDRIKKNPWYALKQYLKYWMAMKLRLSNVDMVAYSNHAVELDAWFLQALFPFLRTDFASFDELKQKFISEITIDHWFLLSEENRNRMLKRLYKFYQYKKEQH